MASQGEVRKRLRDSPALKDRLWYLVHQCSSQDTEVTATNAQGEKVTGKLYALAKGAVKLQSAQDLTTLEGFRSLQFTLEDTLGHSQPFKSDAEIGKARAPGRRELHKYAPDTPLTHVLEDHQTTEKFDQFETNQKLFGVQATFDEGLYTTPLVRPEELTPDQVRRIEKVIKAIERSAGADDTGGDLEEEERFAAVKGTGRFSKPLERQRAAIGIDTKAGGQVEEKTLSPGDSKEYRKLRGNLINCKRLDHDHAVIEALQLEVAPFHNDEVADDLARFKRQKQQEQGVHLKQDLHEFKQEFEHRSSLLDLSKPHMPVEFLEDYCPASLLDLYLDSVTATEHTNPHWPEPAVLSPLSAPVKPPELPSLNPDAPVFEFTLLAS